MRPAAIIFLVALLGVAACLPDPQSVKQRRESFDRKPLIGSLIVEASPADMVRTDVEFGKRIKLLGYTMEPTSPRPGDKLKIKFFWSALAPIAEDYQVFIHGDAIGGNSSRIHGDHYPAEGRYPTDVWRVDEVVADPFTITIPIGYGPKTVGIYAGLYMGNYRVPITNPGLVPSDNENRSQAVTIQLPE